MYDIVGLYNQDKINGFDEHFLESFVELLDLDNAENVLDAMGGNGNLTNRILNYCAARPIKTPRMTLLDYSSVQLEFARATVDSQRVSIVHGDMISMTNLQSGEKLPENSFDRIVIKSGSHEIPVAQQYQLYLNLFRLLKPGGRFINLGFLFNDIQERDEFAEITKVKDTLIGAMENRYFLMREELYAFLDQVGFEKVTAQISFEYVIRSEIVEKEYFSKSKQAITKLQMAQSQAMTLQQHGRIVFNGESSVMRLPGEITIAVKPS